MKLHGYFRSSASFRVRIALNLKGLAYEDAFYHLRRSEHQTPEYLALNPQGLLPSFEDKGLLLTQSMAIMEYLEEVYPQPALMPSDPGGRARVRALSQVIASDIHPLDNLRVLRYLRHEFGQPEDVVQAWYNHWIAEGFKALEGLLARGGTGKFCHGDAPTLADCCLVPQFVNSKNFGLDLSPYPTVVRIAQTCLEMPEFDKALPKNQPDADPA
jgi:maleylpyruvate isomerase